MLALLLLIFPSPALAHSAERGFVMLLPTGYYLAGGAFAVAASFLLLAFAPKAGLQRLAAAELRLFALPRIAPAWTSLLSFALLLLLLATGVFGSRDPLANPLPLFVWTVWWVGFTLLQALTGNLWDLFNPWSGPLRLLGARRDGLLKLPERLGYLPAILIFFAFAWFELVDPAPTDPFRLAVAVALYWCFAFAGMLLFGEATWRARAEPFSIFFRLVGGMAPLVTRAEGDRRILALAWPGRALLELPPLPLSGVLFVLLTLSSVSFDGLTLTFAWLDLNGINPLDFPGRSAVQVGNSLGLLLAFVLLAGVFLGAVALGHRLARQPQPLGEAFGRYVYSVVPISIAFHAAHYLTLLLVNGQYAYASLSDPFGLRWDLFGLGHFHPATGFLTHLESVTTIWNLQTVIICLGHIVGILLAHLLALRWFGSVRAAVASQVGLAVLMVLYTLFGLWLLSTPTAG